MVLLVVFMAVVSAALWVFDPVSQQAQFGELLGAELVAFSMLTYIYTRDGPQDVKEVWMLSGGLALAFLIGLALL